MSKALFILIIPFLFAACNNCDKQNHAKWNEGYDPKRPECFDTVLSNNGDSILMFHMATDSII